MPSLSRNARAVIRVLSAAPDGLTRTEIEDATRLGRTTVQSVVASLVESDEVIEEQAASNGQSGVGRPPARIRLARRRLVAGIDVGHNHLRVGLGEPSGRVIGDTIHDEDCDVDRAGPRALIVAARLLDQLLARERATIDDVAAIVLGVPAPVLDGRVASPRYLASWATAGDLRKTLQDVLENYFETSVGAVVAVENDATLGAIAEGAYGDAKGIPDYCYVKVSSGAGMGIVIGGTPVRGAYGMAGEIGHVRIAAETEERIRQQSTIVPPRRACPRCGQLNCLENLASASAIVAQLQAAEGYAASLKISDIIANARQGAILHPLCVQAITNAGLRIGDAIADLTRILDPKLIVLGGLLAEAGPLLTDPIEETLVRLGLGARRPAVATVDPVRIKRSEVEGAVLLASEAAAAAR